MPTRTPNWLTVNDAAARARKSTRTIRRWITIGDLPAHRINEFGILIDQADLDKLIKPIPAARPRSAPRRPSRDWDASLREHRQASVIE